MHVRLATMRDLPALMDLYHEAADAMTRTPFDCCWRRDGHPTSEFVQSLVERGGMLVAKEHGVLVGAVGTDHDLGHDYGALPWLVDASAEQTAVIHLLVIRQSCRGQGLSRMLLRACLQQARDEGMLTARLDATANNKPAITLYKDEGFTQVGADELDVGPDENPSVPFVVLELPLA